MPAHLIPTCELRFLKRVVEVTTTAGGVQKQTQRILQQKWREHRADGWVSFVVPEEEWRDVPMVDAP